METVTADSFERSVALKIGVEVLFKFNEGFIKKSAFEI